MNALVALVLMIVAGLIVRAISRSRWYNVPWCIPCARRAVYRGSYYYCPACGRTMSEEDWDG